MKICDVYLYAKSVYFYAYLKQISVFETGIETYKFSTIIEFDLLFVRSITVRSTVSRSIVCLSSRVLRSVVSSFR